MKELGLILRKSHVPLMRISALPLKVDFLLHCGLGGSLLPYYGWELIAKNKLYHHHLMIGIKGAYNV